MIDEKKIEEAASIYTEEEGTIFKTGIYWFLDNLWHPASEEPKENESILIEYLFDAKQGKKYCKLDLHKPSYYPWQQKIINEQITRWLYIDDLLEGGK